MCLWPKCLTWVPLAQNLKKTIVIFEITSPEFVNKFHVNKRRPILILLDQNHKNLLSCLNSAFEFVKIQMFIWKTKINLGPKLLYLGILELEFEKPISKKKIDTKGLLFGYFWTLILKNYFHIWNQYLWICQNVNFSCKTKQFWV